MFFSITFALLCASLTNASPVARGSSIAGVPSVRISGGTISGSTDGSVESFKGIPYAQAPTGNLRLKPPQPFGPLGSFNAVGISRSCPQMSPIPLPSFGIPGDVLAQIQSLPLFQTITFTGEDCLNLDVQRPANLPSNSSLPVLVWIYGGGFEFGSTQTYDGAGLIRKSIDLSAPFIYVQMNYRVAGFGFLAGKELQADGSTNLGLRDQRLALEWVQDNIASFGGDPTKVTIWGESAGAISVMDQTIINSGDNSYKSGKLFRGAIMNSGSIVPATDVASPKPQNIYDTVVTAAGCSSAADSLACLRSVSYGTFLNAVNSVPGIFSYRSVDLSYLPRPDPHDNFFPVSPEIAVSNGAFTKVPVIIGDQEDEGTLFSLVQSNITTTDQLITYLTSYFPSNPNARQLVTGLVNTYPDNQSAGSPFRTGVLNTLYPQYKRLAAILGDVTFTLTRRVYLNIVANQVPSWTFLGTYFYGTPILGTFHATDIIASRGLLTSFNVPTQSIQRYYVSFVNFLDPNALGNGAPLVQWPKWTERGRELLNFGVANNQIMRDDFREDSYQYLLNSPAGFRV